MTHLGAGLTGAVLLGVAVLGYLYPVTSEGHTIFSLNDLCNSGIGQIGQAFDKMFGQGKIEQKCLEFKYETYGIIGIGLIGLILVIVGAFVPSRSKEKALTCSYCNYISLSETDLLKHKTDNHLDKSPYKCEHCDFIGITEEVLWNHYKDKHPDKKKW